jgi:hypothetical protein
LDIEHKYPDKLDKKQEEELDQLISRSMGLYFDLRKDGVKDAKQVLLTGTEIKHD